MHRSIRFIALALFALASTACYGTPGDIAAAEAELRGGGGPGVRCGDGRCGAGEVCCNASCGICTPPDGVCTQQVCEVESGGGRGGGRAECQTNDDCRTFSNYCDGCSCDALAVDARDPRCRGDIVYCFAEPCMDSVAVCDSGRCVLSSATTL